LTLELLWGHDAGRQIQFTGSARHAVEERVKPESHRGYRPRHKACTASREDRPREATLLRKTGETQSAQRGGGAAAAGGGGGRGRGGGGGGGGGGGLPLN
ncbi:unnamed protein product, partial [Pleuronectes platessa]